MVTADRVREIIDSNNLKQKEFAKSLNVTESYISKLLRGDSGLSNSTAGLIEHLYGYSAEWLLNGTEPKMKRVHTQYKLTPAQQEIVNDIEKMNEDQINAVLAFINSLDKAVSIETELQASLKTR